MTTYTILPMLVALIAGLALMPTNVYKVCAWNVGMLEIEPWRRRVSASLREAVRGVAAWFAMIANWRFAFALAAILAIVIAYQTSTHDGVLLAMAPVAVAPLKEKRAEVLKNAEALQGKDGAFADDA